MSNGLPGFTNRIPRIPRSFLDILDWWDLPSGGGDPIPDDKCCGLARKDKECNWVLMKSNFSCPDGYYRHHWHCCHGEQQISCGECVRDINEDGDPVDSNGCAGDEYACSIWFYTGRACGEHPGEHPHW